MILTSRKYLIRPVLILIFMAAAMPLSAVDIYWDNHETVVPSNGRFHRAAYGGGQTVLVWHEFVSQGAGRGVVYLSMARSTDGREWVKNERFAGPFEYTGDEVPICSLAVKKTGEIYVAVSADESTLKIFFSTDFGESFTEKTRKTLFSMTVGPRLFIKHDGSFIMFVTRESGNNLSIFYALSDDGDQWTDFAPLVSEAGLGLNFLPHFVSVNGTDYVIFQAFLVQRRSTYQLYMKKSNDGGATWGEAKRITYFDENINGNVSEADNFDNQRPNFRVEGNKIKLAWERRNINEANPQIYYAEFNLDGNLLGEPEKVSRDGRTCNYPRLASFRGETFLTWFDNRMGDYRVIIAAFNGILWRERDLSPMAGNSIFGQPVETDDSLYIFWENRIGPRSRIVMIGPDTHVDTPEVFPSNFTAGRRHSFDRYSFRWNLPDDASGIAGFSYTVSRNREASPPVRVMNTPRQLSGEVEISEDGFWYILLSASDYAGNWSKPAVIPVYRDTTPPGAIVFDEPDMDESGFMKSNTFTLGWEPPSGEPVARYIYNLQLLEENFRRDVDESALARRVRAPDRRNSVTSPELSVRNIDNGIWALSVSAVDEAGNTGEPATAFFRLNRYVPVTIITSIEPVRDRLERISIDIRGRGFTAGGNIHTVILDRDGQEPWDYSFYLDDRSYRIENDRLITDFVVTEIMEGEYRIGLVHPRRGLYLSTPVIRLEPSGTVKFGYFADGRETVWKPVRKKLFALDMGNAGFYTLIFMCAVVMLVSAARLKAAWAEGKQLEKDIRAVIKGVPISYGERKERIKGMRRRGAGLRLKFALFVIFIVLAVVLMVALPLGKFMLETQRKNLVTGLRQQSEVLLESLASGARSYLPASNTLELGLLPGQRTAMGDAVYAPITGKSSGSGEGFDYVWATDDINIYSKITSQELVPGESILNDSVSAAVPLLEKEINEKASAGVSAMVEEVEKLGQQARSLIGRPGSESQLQMLQQQIREYDQRIQSVLQEAGSEVRTYPRFDMENYQIEDMVYVFYKPVIYRQPGENIYYRGLVRLGVSTSGIINEIRSSNIFLIKQTILIAGIAIVFGMIGALLLAAVIINPIRKLVKGLEVIRDTEDKEKLHDHKIQVKSRDELYQLAETVNQMTEGLVKAAAASKDLTLGKEVQKMFIPLEKDSRGRKLTTGKESTDKYEFFGYYEGAKGVSGDYFDYAKLDEDNFALIKCDVAGKGVPASLIMVEVATIFLNYFRHWKSGRKINLTEVIININDMLEERGFQGRFAALIVAVVNIRTGECYLCNAGDNIVHLYSRSENRLKQLTLPESPAAGVFPSLMVAEKFQQVKISLAKGDALMLFTDGVEEAKRNFRNEKFELVKCAEPGMKEGELHGNHYVTAGDEEFGLPRIYDLVNAVFAGTSFTLEKYHNPVPDEKLTFDFSSCTGTMEEAIMAMVSAEKIFRLIPDPAAGEEDRVLVDIKIKEFLEKHFDQYRRYFSSELTDRDAGDHAVFTHLKQDEQYDDLTILAFRRK